MSCHISALTGVDQRLENEAGIDDDYRRERAIGESVAAGGQELALRDPDDAIKAHGLSQPYDRERAVIRAVDVD